MAKQSVGPGDRFFKTGHPGVVWRVERLKQDIAPAHAILIRLDDPATRITVSVSALSNPQFFRRSGEAGAAVSLEPESGQVSRPS